MSPSRPTSELPPPGLPRPELSGGEFSRHRSALTGCAISGVFGALWSLGAASALDTVSAGAAVAVGVVGVLLGLGLAIVSLRIRAGLTRRSSSIPAPERGMTSRMFSTRAYRFTVIGEVVLIVAGGAVLDRIGRGSYGVLWVAAVVGVHFLVFGRLFRAAFYLVGAVLIAGALAGLVLAIVRSNPTDGVTLTSLVAALDLLAAAAIGLRATVRAVAR